MATLSVYLPAAFNCTEYTCFYDDQLKWAVSLKSKDYSTCVKVPDVMLSCTQQPSVFTFTLIADMTVWILPRVLCMWVLVWKDTPAQWVLFLQMATTHGQTRLTTRVRIYAVTLLTSVVHCITVHSKYSVSHLCPPGSLWVWTLKHCHIVVLACMLGSLLTGHPVLWKLQSKVTAATNFLNQYSCFWCLKKMANPLSLYAMYAGLYHSVAHADTVLQCKMCTIWGDCMGS